MGELKEYKGKFLKGSVGNTEYWAEEDWVKHRKYIEELKESGEYLKEEEVTVRLIPDEFWDQNTAEKPCMSYRFDIIDLSKK